MNQIIKSALLALGLTSVVTASSAQDQLYGQAIPDDAAFVRALGFSDGDTPVVFGEALSSSADYSVVLPGDGVEVQPQQVITVTSFGHILHDPIEDRSKVQIALFNAGQTGEITLKTADGKIGIVSAVPDAASFREVNPLVLDVAIFKGDAVVGAPFELKLVRDNNPTIWVDKTGTVEVFYSGVIWEE